MSGPESAPRPPPAPAPPPRRLRCVRCRNHGSVVPLKGHARTCPFSGCTCLKCTLITQRTKIMAGERKRVRPPPAAATAASRQETKRPAPEIRPRPGQETKWPAPEIRPRPGQETIATTTGSRRRRCDGDAGGGPRSEDGAGLLGQTTCRPCAGR